MSIANHQSNCPVCGGAGQSVAAMNYAETRELTTEGTFGGVGMGVTSSGAGVGLGLGVSETTSLEQTRRARVFDEPKPFARPAFRLILGGAIIASLLVSAPYLLSDTGSSVPTMRQPPPDPILGAMEALTTIAPVLLGVVGLLAMFIMARHGLRNLSENSRSASEEYPMTLARYNALRYCGGCHILFDHTGRSEPANAVGFERMCNAERAKE